MSYYTNPNRRNPNYPSRPTSLYGSPSNLSHLGHTSLSQSSPYLNSSSNYPGSSSFSTYGGTSSGYGSLMVSSNHSPTISSPSLLNSLFPGYNSRPSSPNFNSRSSYSPTGYGSPNSSRYPSRSSSFNRHHRTYKASPKYASTSSLASSEGYESEDKSNGSSRLGSVSSPSEDNQESTTIQANGEIDYKKLYEESQLENERLREKLRRTEEDLETTRSLAEKNALLHKNSLSEVEKRERRAMERKLSEMEEELKQLQKLKADNERLRAENRALTRVITNLTSSHKK